MAMTMHVDIVSAEGEIYSGPAEMVYAHAEMERLSEPYEQKLRELFLRSETIEETPHTKEALDVFASLAEVHFAYAESGILDNEMAQFHYQRSGEAAHRTWENGLADVRLMVVNALYLSSSLSLS